MTAFEIHHGEFRKVLPSYDVRYFVRKSVQIKELMKTLEEILVSNSV